MNIKSIGVEEWLNELEKSAALDIAQSTIASLTTAEILALGDEENGGPGTGAAAFYEALGREKQNYGWIEGSPEFKAEVAKLYRGIDGKGIDADNVLQMNGATGANLAALYTLVHPGDHVVAEYPTYDPLWEIPRTLGANVDLWHLRQEADWNPDIEELKRLVTKNTKLICINNASNPLGTVLSRETLEQIVEIARSVGAYVLSDEVYYPLENSEDFASIVDLYERGIATNSLSKTYSVPGIRMAGRSRTRRSPTNCVPAAITRSSAVASSTTPWPCTCCVTASRSSSATARSSSATAPSPRSGSTTSRA